jgi:DNA-binding NarL/FixJ family response regulator
MGSVRILIADDHALIRRGIRTLLSHEPAFDVVAEASNGEDAVESAQRELPDVAILDIGMPALNGIEAARRISAAVPHTQLIMLTV